MIVKGPDGMFEVGDDQFDERKLPPGYSAVYGEDNMQAEAPKEPSMYVMHTPLGDKPTNIPREVPGTAPAMKDKPSSWNIPGRLKADWQSAAGRPINQQAQRDDMSLPLQMMAGGVLGNAAKGAIIKPLLGKFMPAATEAATKTVTSAPWAEGATRQILPQIQQKATELATQAAEKMVGPRAAAQATLPGIGAAVGGGLGAAAGGLGAEAGLIVGNTAGRAVSGLPTAITEKGFGGLARMAARPLEDIGTAVASPFSNKAVQYQLARGISPTAKLMALLRGGPAPREEDLNLDAQGHPVAR